MFNIGPQELLLILVVALLVVGPRRLPELGRSIGKGIREIRKAQDEVRKTIQLNLGDEPPAAGRSSARASGPTSEQADGDGSQPSASAPSSAAAAGEVSRTLGRGLAELRRAREQIQRSFRIDLDPSKPAPGRAGAPTDAPAGGSPDDPGAGGSPDDPGAQSGPQDSPDPRVEVDPDDRLAPE